MRFIILIACLWLTASSVDAKIVFTSNRASKFMEVYTMDSDGTNPTHLTFEIGECRLPVWSPNGRQIAFDVTWGMDTDLLVIDVDGNNPRRLTDQREVDRSPHWHPDGNLIAFIREARRLWGAGIYTVDLNGGEPQLVIRANEIRKVRWSPDGTKIAFSGSIGQDDPTEIHVVDPDGKRLWRVSKRLPETRMILGDWSPDSKKLLYTVVKDRLVGAAENQDYLEIVTFHSELRQAIKREQFLKHIDPLVERWGKAIPTRGFGFSPDGKSILIGIYLDDSWDIYRYYLDDGKLTQLTDDDATDRDAQEWNPWLAVPPQQEMRLKTWGAVKQGDK